LPGDFPTLSLPANYKAIFCLCDSYIATFRSLSILYGHHATFSASKKRKEKSPWLTWMKAQWVAEGLLWPLALWRQSRSFCWSLSVSLAKT
jgi:hypothetical protein